MATKMQVTILCFLLFVSYIFGATVFKDNFELIVPSDAKVGHIVTKLGCSDNGLTIRPEIKGHVSDNLFLKLFVIDQNGNLVVRKDLSVNEGNYFIVTVNSVENCFQNVEKRRTFNVFITSPRDHLNLGAQIFKGSLDINSKPGDLVSGLGDLVKVLKNPRVTCSLVGDSLNLFDTSSEGIKLLAKPQSISKAVYYFLHCTDGIAQSTPGIHISFDHQSIHETNFDTTKRYPQSHNENNVFDDISVGFETPVLHRRKRQSIDVRTLSINENVTDVLTLENPQPGTATQWSVVDSTNTFVVNNQGKVSVLPGKKLDYDAGQRFYDISVIVKSADGQTVLKTYQVSITVKDINDEPPKITNHPAPFQERVDPASTVIGARVFLLKAEDPDTTAVLRFFLDGNNDNFQVEQATGNIRTKRTLANDNVYTVRAYAQDEAGSTPQRTPTVEVYIYTRDLSPQFNESRYTAKVQEKNQPSQTFVTDGPEGTVSLVYAINFQQKLGGSTIYTVQEGATTSDKFRIDEAGELVTLTTLDYETDPTNFFLKVVATDTKSQMSSSVNLTVQLEDVNEFDPTFTLSTYTNRIAEDLAPGSPVLQVTATDQDKNSILHFWVSDPLFKVVSQTATVGQLQVNNTLDYDRLSSHRYEFDIYVSDNGQPSRTSQAKVLIDLTNVNDEKPEFQDSNMVTTIKDNTQSGSDIYLVQAVDLDGDQIRYSLGNHNDVFEINLNTGQIRLRTSIPPTVDQYVITVRATDDNSCCPNTGSQSLFSESTVTVNIVSASNNKPTFTTCDTYQPEVKENQPVGTSVIVVSATDNDRGENGIVEYFAVTSGNTKDIYFAINKTTGEVTTTQTLDRESFGSRYLFFTVRAVDKGSPPADDYCTFRISIGDENDNDPVFGSASYNSPVLRTAGVNSIVMTVKATDKDIGVNAEVTYSKVTVTEWFEINADTGVITVAKLLSSAPDTVSFSIRATDKGTPPRTSNPVSIVITISNDDGQKPPIWSVTSPTFQVNETARQDYLIGSLTATSQIAGSSGVTFTAIADGNAGSQVPPFYIKTDSANLNQVNIYILNNLNYEEVKSYTFQLRARDNKGEVYTDVFPQITVIDQNDEIPNFRGANLETTFIEATVLENLAPGADVATIAATDEDVDPRFKQLSYSLSGDNAQYFSINPGTGLIKTNFSFDREATPNYYMLLNVQVNDGFPSARPGSNGQPNSDRGIVRVKIGDVNDNEPYFQEKIYYATIKEDAFISDIVTTVEATDLDEATFQYSIVPGPGSNFFSIKTRELKGEIVVAGNLDYETGEHKYNLTVRVNDGKFTNQTLVEVSIEDVNDNPPVFAQSNYLITNVTEEVQYSPSNPLYILTANATDPDTFRQKGIEYRISDDDPTISQLFTIDSTTGVLQLIGKLDRDRPNGREVYQFNLLAVDEPGETTRLTGYATVQIRPIDINDNAPRFLTNSLTGSVKEGSPIGITVMRVLAEDYDAGQNAEFTFELLGDGTPRTAFRINPDNGDVITTVNDLDRETDAQFFFTIMAKDKGTNPKQESSTATVTVNLIDVNDNKPVFNESVYKVTIPETHTGTILKIKAYDPDVDETLRYSLNTEAYKHFTITTQGREGIIGVYNGSNPDYEAGERFFNLTAIVRDRDDKYNATTNIQITITDVNDETPIFENGNERKELFEGSQTPVGTAIANFTATDRDTGINGKIRYFISNHPLNEEPRKYFSLQNFPSDADQRTTTVILQKELDRETIPVHTVHVLAIDSGIPELTGTATLTVVVKDINDEYPRIKGIPYAKIMENSAVNTYVDPQVFLGEDPDTPENGPPFGFSGIACSQPSSNLAECQFQVMEDQALDNGNGGFRVRSRAVFDREVQKFYYLPIRTWDQRGKTGVLAQTGTNTLTIEIGDINDNPHGPGTQEIHVYNYKGLFKNIDIGQVNYADLDDHDIGDKTFTFKGPAAMEKFFSVRREDGMVKLLHNVPTGIWTFEVSVFDRVDKITSTSTVRVTIEEMPEEAPFKSGSVRLTGTTAEQFITPDNEGKTPYSKFRSRLATSLKTDENNVEMISVIQNGEYTDVRFSAHGSPYYSPTKMNGVILKDQAAFQQDSGGTISMINIDECLQETCESGCYNYLNVTGRPNLVNVRGSSIVGVETFVQGKCGCHEPVSQTDCDPTYCYNGGTCKKDYWNVMSCECSPGFDGPRCQSTRHGFDGTGYALYKPLEQCENSETSIEFITTSANGLIMYLGPVSDNGEPQDFLSLALINGYPELRIDHGSGVEVLSITSSALNGGTRLNDGKWHHINIIRKSKLVTMTVDYCRDIKPSTDSIIDDRSACEVTKSTPGENKFLNVNSPLQLGGRYTAPNLPAGITTNKFNGCVRNLRHNKELYDLYTGSGTYPGSFDGCPKEDDSCQSNSINLPKKCENGDCQLINYITGETTCVCYSGWRGDRCEINTTVVDLHRAGSYIHWSLQAAFQQMLSQWDTDVHLMYRTRDSDGVIFHVSSTITDEFIRLEIVNSRLQVLYNLGDGNHLVGLDRVPASDGQWHKIVIMRRGKFMSLAMDNGEGIHYAETQGPDFGHHLFEVRGNQIYSGASLDFSHNSPQVADKDLDSVCLNDIRLASGWFPANNQESNQNSNIKLAGQIYTDNDCSRPDCDGNPCPSPFVCRPLWEKWECVCPLHHIKVGSTCAPIDYCTQLTPCHPDAECVNDVTNDYGYRCICHAGWTGRTCYQGEIVEDDTNVAIAAIVVPIIAIILIIIIVILLFLYCRRTEDALIDEDEKEDYEIRENVMDYDEEGAGEDDYEGHIEGLSRLPDMSRVDKPVNVNYLGKSAPPQGGPGIGDFIGDRLGDADDDGSAPPYDTMKTFDFEGEGSEAGSLSSLGTSTSGGDQDYDYLNEWGPKFAKLADMYNKYEDSE